MSKKHWGTSGVRRWGTRIAVGSLVAALLPTVGWADAAWADAAWADVVVPGPVVQPAPVVSWGGPADLQDQLSPPDNLTDAVAVSASDSAGSYSSLALRADGTVVGWGVNAFGEATPPADLTDVVAIDSGPGFSVALRADGSVVAWGTEGSGQLDVPKDLGPVTAISAGGYFSYQGIGVPDRPCGFGLALRTDRTVVRWGTDQPGLGCELLDARLDPPAGLADVVAISAGSNQALALRADGTVAAWGQGTLPGLDGTPPQQWTDVVAISAGSGNNLGLRRDGSVLAYGIWGESGPPQVSEVKALSASSRDLFLLLDGTMRTYPTSTGVPQGGGYQAVSAGSDYGLAIQPATNASHPPVVGSDAVQPWVDSNPAGTAEAFQYTATDSGTVSTFAAYLDASSTASRVIVGVYADEDGEPGSLLAGGRTSEPRAGQWNEIALRGELEITAGERYWLALLTPRGSGTIAFRDLPEGSGGPTRLSGRDDLSRYRGLPATWVSSKTYANSPASLYLS